MIPPIWFVELTRIDMSNTKRRANHTLSSSIEIEDLLEEFSKLDEASLLSNAVNNRVYLEIIHSMCKFIQFMLILFKL